jgi:pSer/pThr/pTyr-binding forkhead associated (FHA) protein
VLATLTVLSSDDPMLVDQVLNITQPTTQLGRGVQNDIIFPKDTPVSRQHAVIECKGGQFFLSEVCIPDDTGALKRPRYGTFVNEKPLQLTPFQLRSGSVIRLGPRVKLELRLPHRPGDDLTMDGEDATQDGDMATLDGFADATKDGSLNPARPADQENTLADND